MELAILLLDKVTGCTRRSITPRIHPTPLPTGSPTPWKTLGTTPLLTKPRPRNA